MVFRRLYLLFLNFLFFLPMREERRRNSLRLWKSEGEKVGGI